MYFSWPVTAPEDHGIGLESCSEHSKKEKRERKGKKEEEIGGKTQCIACSK